MEEYALSLLLDTICGREIEYIISDYFQMGLIGSSGFPIYVVSEMDTIHFFHGKKKYGQLHITIKQRADQRIWMYVYEVDVCEDREELEDMFSSEQSRKNAIILAEARKLWEKEHIKPKPDIKLKKLKKHRKHKHNHLYE